MADPMNEPGALLAELNHLRKLYVAAVDLVKHMRKTTRIAEEMAPREVAEQLGSLATSMADAYAKHLTGANEEAIRALTPKPDEPDDD